MFQNQCYFIASQNTLPYNIGAKTAKNREIKPKQTSEVQ